MAAQTQLENLVNRLEKVADRLEKVSIRGGGSGGHAAVGEHLHYHTTIQCLFCNKSSGATNQPILILVYNLGDKN